MAVNAEAIHGTRPWRLFGEGAPVESPDQNRKAFNENSRRALDGNDIRFTAKGDVLYAFAMGRPAGRARIRSLAAGAGTAVGRITGVELLGREGPLQWTQDEAGLSVAVPDSLPSPHAIAFRIRGAVA
jgi:alpha-L-fucosidase